MISYRPTPFRRSLAQAATPGPATPVAPAAAPAAPAQAAPPIPVPAYTQYSGVPGFVETVAVLGVSAAAAWVGVRTGIKEKTNKTLKVAGWVGGVGSALIGLLYLGQKSGVGTTVGLPAVRVTA